MAKRSNLLSSKILPVVFLAFSLISAILFRSFRTTWVFINITVRLEFFTVLLFVLIVLTALLLTVLSALRVYDVKKDGVCIYNKKAYRILLIVGMVASAFFLLFTIIYALGIVFTENLQVFTLNLKNSLSEGALPIIIPFLLIFYPKLNNTAKKTVFTAGIIAVTLFAVNSFFPLKPYKITSVPVVIDNGSAYSIVFSTNDYGTAYVEYSFDDKDYKVFDHTGGRLNSDKKIHNIEIPYEHLRNNTYKIGSTRVIEEFSYGSRRGKTVTSEEFTFTYNGGDNQTFLVISDWHTMLDKAYTAIDNLKSDYDAVILLGDASPGVDYEEQVIKHIVQFGGKVSSGIKPVIFVRGNHETRGAYANDLPRALGLEQLYYTCEMGSYSFVVLDSGEDKDDSHIEYGGMTDYNTSRADMIKWLKTVETKNDKVIALSHSWKISDVEKENSEAGWSELSRLGVRLLLSGHEHSCRFIGDKDSEKEFLAAYPDIIGYIDGGKTGDNYIASMLELDSDGFTIKAVDSNGEKIIQETFQW